MIDFLLEIGFEEFPPSFLKKAAEGLSTRLENLLKDKRIFHRTVRTIYTPRRIGTLILGLTRKQKSQTIEIQGPPRKIAFDSNGKPTKMLLGFMKANNLKLSQIFTKKIEKGEYVYGKKVEVGAGTEEILYEGVPQIIRSLEFPKTMVWDKSSERFPRPVRWIVALLDRKPLRFEFAGVEADRYSSSNPHFSFKPIRLEKPREYINFLRHGGVVVDPNERKKMILKRIKQITEKMEGEPGYTDEMIEEINCATEYPEVVSAEFDSQYLDLPGEVLMTVLKNQGNLIWMKGTNKFICVFNAKKRATQNVKKGYTNVVAAKLYDAHFYYKNDLSQGLENMLEQSKRMMWLKDLGSLYDKAVRLNRSVELFQLISELDMAALKRAAMLCKADLVSQMVREKDFTSLQGIMGGYYATLSNDGKVAAAIKEHYLPRFFGDDLPKTREGAILSICDKIDNVVGAFLSGNRPSGSYDPLGIRRNGYGAIALLDVNNIHVSLFKLMENFFNDLIGTLKLPSKKVDKEVELNIWESDVRDFFKERLTRYLQDTKFRYDEINAVLAIWQGGVPDARMRCEALKEFRDKPEFTKLVIGQKRVRNILKGMERNVGVNEGLLQQVAEKKLYKKGLETESKLKELFQSCSYLEILNLLLAMRADIDKFFDDVLVMCDDENLKNNRLALVNFINELFLKFANFSEIVIEGEK